MIAMVERHGMLWIEAAAELEAAKARVGVLMRTTPCEYLIFSQKTGHKISTHKGGRYALQVVWVSQPEEIPRGDGQPFPRTEKY
jgi:hypothetical protein